MYKRNGWYVCRICNEDFFDHHKGRNPKYCSIKCVSVANKEKIGDKNPKWKPKGVHSAGYIRLNINGHRILEHHYIMEQHLNRKLNIEEIVHHINENKTDNRLSNLQIVSRQEHIRLHKGSNI